MTGDMSRFDLPPGALILHTNDTLICRDCRFRYRIVGSCEKYTYRKPQGILDDTQMCPHYQPEDNE